jgi:endonuclease YncB( thermonuclease family)
VTHVRDGDTIVVDDIPIRLAGLDCPEKGTEDGDHASGVMAKLKNNSIQCELTGAKTFDRLVGYCSLNGKDLGAYMMLNSTCKVWQKYDVWHRY